jgi:putative DNA primase/helicase
MFKEVSSTVILKGQYATAINVIVEKANIIYLRDLKKFYSYANGIYQETYLDAIGATYRELVNEHDSNITTDAFCKYIQRLSSIQMESHQFFKLFEKDKKNNICFSNGVYNVTEDKLYPHSKNFYFRSKLNAAYDPTAKCPVFDKFLDDFTCNQKDLAQSILEFLGYSLISGYNYGHAFMILDGQGRNGKSTLINVMSNILGYENISSIPMSAMEDKFMVAGLAGKLLNCSTEESAKWISGQSLGILKAITGGDAISINQKFKATYIERDLPKMIFAMNGIPSFTESTIALKQRCIIIPCEMDLVGKENPHIEKDMEFETSGIAQLLLRSLKQVIKNKKIFKAFQNEILVSEMARESSVIERFFEDRIQDNWNDPKRHQCFITAMYCYEQLIEYGKDEKNYDIPTFNTFCKKMSNKLGRRRVRRKTVNGKLMTVYMAIQITDGIENFEDAF